LLTVRFAESLIASANTKEAHKKLRYAAVAMAFLPVGQGLIQVLGPWLNDYTAASLLAAAIVTVPNFFANRHFVWRVTSDEKLRRQVVTFWVAVMLAVLLTTFFTYIVENGMVGQRTLVRGIAVFFAQVLGFGVVWIGRFFLLDRWLFKLANHPREQQLSTEIPIQPG
jgi:putative flippase GtrA